MHKLSKFILNFFGFKVVAEGLPWPPKYIVAVVPHTSNWDFPMGLLTRSALHKDIKFIGKASLFRPPFGWIFRSLGGYPVDRSKSTNFVDAVVDIFNSKEFFAISMAPEGTRKKVDKLKTGFYYIAKGARVPIILCKFDFANKEVHFGKPFYPTDNKEKDFEYIENYFWGVHGKNPENSFGYIESDKKNN